MDTASFSVQLDKDTAQKFAEISGDWNPLHTDADYAAETSLGKPILHGAYAAGLISRMAGMYLPGEKCLLQRLQLRFVQPIFLPVELVVSGKITDGGTDSSSRVDVEITDQNSGLLYVQGNYDFGSHEMRKSHLAPKAKKSKNSSDSVFLLTGSSGGLGWEVRNLLGETILPIPSKLSELEMSGISKNKILDLLGGRACKGIVHCGWPSPDNKAVTTLSNIEHTVDHYVANPLKDTLLLAQVLFEKGTVQAPLILVGSSAVHPGRHAWRHPMYSLGKSLLPTLTKVLSLELGAHQKKAIGVTFDVLDGGMNASQSALAKQSNHDRHPSGKMGTMREAAENIVWLLENTSMLINGATVDLTGGAIP